MKENFNKLIAVANKYQGRALIILFAVSFLIAFIDAFFNKADRNQLRGSTEIKESGTASGKEAILSALLEGKDNFQLDNNPVMGVLDPEDPEVKRVVARYRINYPKFTLNLLKVGITLDQLNRYSMNFDMDSEKCIFTTVSHDDFLKAQSRSADFTVCIAKASDVIDQNANKLSQDEIAKMIEDIISDCKKIEFQTVATKVEEIDKKYCEKLYKQKL